MPGSVAASTVAIVNATNQTTHNITLPAATVGDRFEVIFVTDGTPVFTWDPLNVWGGRWQSVSGLDGNDLGATSRLEYRYLEIQAGDGTALRIDTSVGETSVVICRRITGHMTAQAPEGTAATGRDQLPDPPLIAPTWGQEASVWTAAFGADGSTGDPATAYPTQLTDNNQTTEVAGASGVVIAGATAVLTATSINPSTFTLGTGIDDWRAISVVHRSSAATGAIGSQTSARRRRASP